MRPYLIFDWDGTLADSAALIVGSMQAAIGTLGLPSRPDEAIRELIGLGLAEGMERLYPEIETVQLLGLLGQYRRQVAGQGPAEAPLFSGAEAALRTLNDQGHALAVATGKSRPGLNRSLRHHSALAPLFQATRTADETANKPDPLMLRELLDEAGLAPGQALMIGDTEYDADMARAIGMPFIGVACGVHAPQRLLASGAQAVLETVADLPRWLQGRA